MDIGRKIKKLRSDKGLTQLEFAEKLKISNRELGRYEFGLNEPSEEILNRIANFCNIAIEDFGLSIKEHHTYAYLKSRSGTLSIEQQKDNIIKYTKKQKIKIKNFIEWKPSAQRKTIDQKISSWLEIISPGDTLIVDELSRLGRSVGEIIILLDALKKNNITVISLEEKIIAEEKNSLLSLFANLEKKLISIRIKEGLAARKTKGMPLGKPRGSKNKTRRLDSKKEIIQEHLQLKVPLNSIRKILNNILEKPISYNALRYFVEHDPILKSLRN